MAGAHTLQSEQAIGFPVAAAIGVLQDVYLLAWTFAVCNVCREAGVLGLLLPAWALSAAAWAGLMTVGVVLNVQALSGIEPGNGVRAELTFGDPNMASNYYVMALMVLWASRRPRRWPLRAAAGLLLLAGMAFTGSNGGVVNLGVSAGVCLILLAGRRWGVPAAVACALVLGLAVATEVTLLPPQTIQLAARQSGQPILRDWIGRSDQSAAQRLVLVDEASTLYGEGGLLGLGPGSTKPILALTQANYVHAAHDDYVASLVERGLLGALGLVLLIGAIAVRSAQVLRRPLRRSFAAVVDPVPLVAALAGLACAATFYQVLHFRHVWALLGILAAIHIWGVRRLEPV